MNIDSLIGSYFRRSNRRYLSFRESPTGTCLPAPESERQYLLYLHVPYCVALCPFCFFHRFKFRKDRAERYFRALRREIRLATEAGYRFSELYVGGGTPTVLPGELTRTIRLVRKLHPVRGISVETNAGDLIPDTLQKLRDAGVNRLSVGVQSFDDGLLKEMHRFDKFGSGEQIRNRLSGAQGIFDTLNVDMIFNFPHQAERSLRDDLNTLVDELGIDQVSYYPLMSADSKRKTMQRTVGAVDYSRERSLYRIIAEFMLANGYTRSPAWCFSREAGMSDEYIVEHEEYLGLGSGSFSYLRGTLFASTFSIDHYLRLIDSGAIAMVRRRDLSERDQMRYYLLTNLFTGSMCQLAAEDRFAGRFRQTMWPELAALRTMGATLESDRKIELTEAGYYLWVMMMREFFTGVNKLRDEMRHNIVLEHELLPAVAD